MVSARLDHHDSSYCVCSDIGKSIAVISLAREAHWRVPLIFRTRPQGASSDISENATY